MKKFWSYGTTALFVTGMLTVWTFDGCVKNNSPSNPSSNPGLSGTPGPSISGGVLNIFVLDKSRPTPGISGLSVEAIPPSGGTPIFRNTGTNGGLAFKPDSGELETGTWTLVAAAGTPFPPYAPSTLTMSVTAANEAVTFETQQDSLQVMPLATPQYTSNTGSKIPYQITYTQPGSLLVPVWFFAGAPTGWALSGSPVTIGGSNVSSATVTLVSTQCVDQVNVPVTFFGVDATSNTLNSRAQSLPQTITKNLPSNVNVSFYEPFFNNYSSCNLEKQCSSCTLTVTSTNSCATVYVWFTEPNTNCTSGSFNTPNGNTSASNSGGGKIVFPLGTYNITYLSDGGFPTFYAQDSSTGATSSVQVGNGTFTLLNDNY